MRLFIAVNFDEKTKDNISGVQERLRALGKGNFTRRDNMHLTLAFLGELPESDPDSLKAIMNKLEVPDMPLEFSRVGCFRGDSELWWIGLKENKELSYLQEKLITLLKDAGFKPDNKKFKPHITLARKMHIGSLDSKQILPKPFKTRADSISLMLSHRPNGRLTYTELYKKSGK